MAEQGEVVNLVSHTTILALSFFLIALLILLFFLYKYLNKEANGKYTVQRIVFREGGLRDRARDASVAMANRLGVQLGRQRNLDSDEEDEAYGDEEEGQVNSNGNDGEDDAEQVDQQKSDSAAELNDVKGSSEDNSADSSDEEQQPLVEPEPEPKREAGKVEEPAAGEAQEDKLVTSGPIVINLNQLSGSVQWSEEDGGTGVVGDVTPL